jgi:excisionase family DNA binding protein
MQKGIRNRLTLSTHLSGVRDVSDEWVSQAEAGRIRGVSRQAIARLVKKGRFQVLKIGGKILLKRSEVKMFEPERPGRRRK